MNLEQYREKLHRRIRMQRVLWIIYLLLLASTRLAGATVTEHPAFAGIMGFVAGGLLVTGLGMSKLHRALKDDTALRRLYHEEHDERKQAIYAKAGIPVTIVLGLAMMAAGLVATFFDVTVALTLIVAAVAQMLVCLVLKFWYMRTM